MKQLQWFKQDGKVKNKENNLKKEKTQKSNQNEEENQNIMVVQKVLK